MKKIIIVNNNLQVGGVQKSLCNLLQALDGKAEVTLLLFSRIGAYADQLPAYVRVIEAKSLFRYLGVHQGACKGLDKLKRGVLAMICRLFGRPAAMKILLSGQKCLPEEYDCAIAFLHNGNEKNFYGGTQEFVLHKILAAKKIAFLHGDYRSCGANTPGNNALIRQFDQVAACSDGCRDAFAQVLPELADRCVTVKNCHYFEQIRGLSLQEAISYDADCHNVVMVSRLSHEKGIERAIEAAAFVRNHGIALQLHIVGSGAMEAFLREQARRQGMEEAVHFYGEQSNPYPYMRAADLFLMTSFHEAAPMVIEEARCLGVPTLTVRTTSSDEMVTAQHSGWVCENDQDALNQALLAVLSNGEELDTMRNRMRSQTMDNSQALAQFMNLIEG